MRGTSYIDVPKLRESTVTNSRKLIISLGPTNIYPRAYQTITLPRIYQDIDLALELAPLLKPEIKSIIDQVQEFHIINQLLIKHISRYLSKYQFNYIIDFLV